MISSYRFFWKTGRLRAFVEGWMGTAILLAVLMRTIISAPPLVISAFFVLAIILGDSIAALRLAFIQGQKKQIILYEVLSALIFALGMFAIFMAEFSLFNALDLPERSHVGLAGFIIFMVLIAPGFLAVRAAGLIWLFWDRLRRTHVVWGLTHSLLIVIGSLGAVVLLISVILTTSTDINVFAGLSFQEVITRLIIWSLSLFITLLAVITAGIAVFMVPVAAFSYLVARHLTRRLGSLITAAKSIESGDLSTRVTVEGEDEVALLQRTFNSMAENIQSSAKVLKSEKEKVSELLQVQQELIAGVSHELRTPAAVISGYLESLRNRWQSDPPDIIDRDLQTISDEAARLKNILNDLLDLSQAKANRFSIYLQPVSLTETMKHIFNVFQPLAWESKRVEFTLDIPSNLPMILADPKRLEQILFNLAQNSLRHTSPGGLVAVAIFQSADRIQVDVADTGEGISPEDMPHIWEKFYRGNETSISAKDGTGLGLAIVKELTEAMGGQVNVESKPGQGSVFSLQFPIVK